MYNYYLDEKITKAKKANEKKLQKQKSDDKKRKSNYKIIILTFRTNVQIDTKLRKSNK